MLLKLLNMLLKLLNLSQTAQFTQQMSGGPWVMSYWPILLQIWIMGDLHF